MGGVQAIKECKINLEHLKMHHAQAQRLRHTLRADEAEQKSLLFKQQGLAADVTKCAVHDFCPTHVIHESAACCCPLLRTDEHSCRVPEQRGCSTLRVRQKLAQHCANIAARRRRLKAELAVVEGRLEEFKEQREAAEKLRATLAVRQDDVARHRERMPQDAWDVLEHSGTSDKLTSHRELVRSVLCACVAA